MRGFKVNKKIVAFAVLGSFLVCVSQKPEFTAAKDSKKTAYDLAIEASREKKEELENAVAELKKSIEGIEMDFTDMELYILSLDTVYADTFKALRKTTEAVDETSTLVDIATEDRDLKRVAEREQYKIMSDRIRCMYENGKVSFADVVFGSRSISDFLNRIEYRAQISEYDNDIYEEYLISKNEAEKTEELLSARLEELLALQNFQQEALSSLEEMALKKENDLLTLAAEYNVDQEALFEHWDEILATGTYQESEALFEQIKLDDDAAFLLENIKWPLPGRSYISSYFGYRDAPTEGAQVYHRGIDIPANTGTTVRAAMSGKVVTATYEPSSGNYVKIYHGNGVYTVYCHASELIVEAGEEVKQGQPIMYVGTTGVSTGPHLHFGLIIDSKYVDPLEYVSADNE